MTFRFNFSVASSFLEALSVSSFTVSASYPIFWIRLIMSYSDNSCSLYVTVAFSVVKLTVAVSTLYILFSIFSIRDEKDAHVIPVLFNSYVFICFCYFMFLLFFFLYFFYNYLLLYIILKHLYSNVVAKFLNIICYVSYI